MTVIDLIEEILRRWPRAKVIADDYHRVLGRYEGQKLQAAWESTIDRWRQDKCPRPSHIMAKISDNLPALRHGGRQETPAEKAAREARERKEWVDRIMLSAEGAQALRGGYGRELYLWAERHIGEYPTDYDIGRCQSAETKFRDTLHSLIGEVRTAPPVTQLSGLAMSAAMRLSATMDAFENTLCREYGITRTAGLEWADQRST